MYAIKYSAGKLYYIDQTKLPLIEVWKECRSLQQGYNAIKTLEVRGAPLIGVFAAYCVAVVAAGFSGADKAKFIRHIKKAIVYLRSSRPTAVNLFWALRNMEEVLEAFREAEPGKIKKELLDKAVAIHKEDIRLCASLADFGSTLIEDGDNILTHCNAGFLATSGAGTALAPIYKAHKQGKKIHVYADETRPLLQGARLTAWELSRAKIPCTLICDNMAAYLMQKGKIDKVFLGADRIASNGDTANKIGTYGVAVNAKHHKIPFYVVAPFSTFDLKIKSGKEIPIEERRPDEVRNLLGKAYIAPKKINVFNPAFDVTPNILVTALVTDKGVIYPPYQTNIKKAIK